MAASMCGTLSHRRGHKSVRLNSGVRPVHKPLSVLLAFTLAACGCGGPREPVHVRNACNTFVSEGAPRQTPELRQGSSGFELVLSYTPAPNGETQAIHTASLDGPLDLVVHPGMERLHVLGDDDGHLVIAVASPQEAERVKRLLCF